MRILTKIENAVIKIKHSIQCYKRRKKLKRKDFTIISNNCWGGFVYQYYGLKYKSPTIGLFFIGNDYVKFCKNLKYYINQELEFIPFDTSKNYEIIKGEKQYPIARLGDIEVYFMHYRTVEEAKAKWSRRCKRINWDHIIYKISQREGYSKADIEEFVNITHGKIVSFSYEKVEGSIFVKELEGYNGDEISILSKYYDIDEIINKSYDK